MQINENNNDLHELAIDEEDFTRGTDEKSKQSERKLVLSKCKKTPKNLKVRIDTRVTEAGDTSPSEFGKGESPAVPIDYNSLQIGNSMFKPSAQIGKKMSAADRRIQLNSKLQKNLREFQAKKDAVKQQLKDYRERQRARLSLNNL